MISARTILYYLHQLMKRKDEPPPVRERYPLDVEEALQARFEAGKQAGLKEQAGLAGINVLEALHAKFQAGIQAGLRLSASHCEQGHPLRKICQQSKGVYIFVCDTCSKQVRQSMTIDQVSTKVLNLRPGEWSRQWNMATVETQELVTIRKIKKP